MFAGKTSDESKEGEPDTNGSNDMVVEASALSEEQKRDILEQIRNATSLDEIDRLERLLQESS